MPLSVLSSWKGDLKRFCSDEDINVHVHHGNKEERMSDFEAWRKRLSVSAKVRSRSGKMNHHQSASSTSSWKVSIVLTTYDLAIKDVAVFQKIGRSPCRWSYLVVDEAHRLKNRASILFDALTRTNASRRLLLTGTPLQNNLGELWSLLSFILPDIFNDMAQFAEWFNRPFEFDDDDTLALDDRVPGDDLGIVETGSSTIGASAAAAGGGGASSSSLKRKHSGRETVAQSGAILSAEERALIVTSLHRVLKPFLLRRLKADVVLDMPQKIERTVYCPFTGLQKQVYEVIRSYVEKQDASPRKARGKSGFSDVDGGSATAVAGSEQTIGEALFSLSNGVSFNNVLMHLRKLCNHPFLVLEDLRTIPDELYYRYLIASSGKMCMLDRLLRVLLPRGHKILIFSQMTTTLDVLQGYLVGTMGVECCRLDGATIRESREEQLAAFQNNGDGGEDGGGPRLFLLSTRAGAVGINLQAADTVIFFDSDWNPQQDNQAMSRSHRLGQTKTVLVLRLVSVGAEKGAPSVEERILRRAAHKLAAERVVLADGEFDMGTCAPKLRFADVSTGISGPVSAGVAKDNSMLMSLFSSRGVEIDAELASLDTRASDEGSGTTTNASGNSSSSSSSSSGNGSNSGSDVGADDASFAFAQCSSSSMSTFSSDHREDTVKLEAQAIVALCNRPLAGSHEASISDADFSELCKLISAQGTEPLGPYASDAQVVLDWAPWLGVPVGMEDSVRRLSSKNVDDAELGTTPKKSAGGRQKRSAQADVAVDATPRDALETKKASKSPRLAKETAEPRRRESPREKQQTQFYGSYHCDDVTFDGATSTGPVELPPVGEGSLCFLCQQPWISAASYRCQLGLKNPSTRAGLSDEQRELIMLDCVNCARLFHMVCIDLYHVPGDEWVCRFCEHAKRG